MASKLDDLTKYIQDKLAENHLEERVNVIHLSDHGMASVTPQNFINLTDFVRKDAVDFYGTSPVVQVVPKESGEPPFKLGQFRGDQMLSHRLRARRRNSGEPYQRRPANRPFQGIHHRKLAETLASHKCTTTGSTDCGCGRRLCIPRYVRLDGVAERPFQSDKWEVSNILLFRKHYEFLYFPVTPTTKFGIHGYDNAEDAMHAFFMAKGPQIARGKQVEPFSIVDLFNLFCRILNIKCRPNEGADRTGIWDQMLRPSKARSTRSAREPSQLRKFASSSYRKMQSFFVNWNWRT